MGCPLCGGQHARKTRAVGTTDCMTCGDRVCTRHIKWTGDGWVCKRCIRREAKRTATGGR